MFAPLLISGIIVVIIGGAWLYNRDYRHPGAIIVLAFGLILMGGSFITPQGSLYWKQFTASGKSGNWMVIDNSGGETLRHWVLEGGYVESSSQSDGWQFYDAKGNLQYVSRDAHVMRINEPFDEFLENYRELYNVPEKLPRLR